LNSIFPASFLKDPVSLTIIAGVDARRLSFFRGPAQFVLRPGRAREQKGPVMHWSI
jgi:hypothetical protein